MAFLSQLGWEWTLQISSSELRHYLWEIIRDLASDGLLMPATLFYIFILPFSRSFFDDGAHYEKNKAWWKKIMAGYNLFMSVLSMCMFVVSAKALYETPLYTENCPLLFSNESFRVTTKIFYFTKFIEYADTFWLYVMNKPVTWLQWFHHIGAAMLMWEAVREEQEVAWIFVVLNSFIHTFMYLYYALSLNTKSKSRFLECVKPYVTSAQIVQFLTGFYFVYKYPKVKCFYNNTRAMLGTYYFTWLYVGTVLLLFLNFYARTYCKCGRRKGKKVAEANGVNGVHTDPTAKTNGKEKQKQGKEE